MAFLRQTTPNGFAMDELYSAFQKSVRRGLVKESLEWSKELGQVFPGALRKRLILFALEDAPYLSLLEPLSALRDPVPLGMLLAWTEKVALAPKTHATAWLNRLAIERLASTGTRPARLDVPQQEDQLVRATDYMRLGSTPEQRAWIKTHAPRWNGVFSASGDSSLAAMAAILALKSPDGCILMAPKNLKTIETPKEIPAWALDKHTRRGKQAGAGYEQFFDSGLLSFPRLFDEEEPFATIAKEMYRLGKKSRELLEAFRSEPDPPYPVIPGYMDLLQTQLITARHKPRTWYATEIETGLAVVIKGPVEIEQARPIFESEALKARCGLYPPRLRVIDTFLVWDSLWGTFDPHAFTVTSSKIETNVRIATPPEHARAWNHEDIGVVSDKLKTSLFIALAFRKCVGTNDTTPRNLLVLTSEERVLSIDDPVGWENQPTMFMLACNPARKKAYTKALHEAWPDVRATLESWKDVTEVPDFFHVTRSMLIETGPDGWVW